jgi:hypothetical protein
MGISEASADGGSVHCSARSSFKDACSDHFRFGYRLWGHEFGDYRHPWAARKSDFSQRDIWSPIFSGALAAAPATPFVEFVLEFLKRGLTDTDFTLLVILVVAAFDESRDMANEIISFLIGLFGTTHQTCAISVLCEVAWFSKDICDELLSAFFDRISEPGALQFLESLCRPA